MLARQLPSREHSHFYPLEGIANILRFLVSGVERTVAAAAPRCVSTQRGRQYTTVI